MAVREIVNYEFSIFNLASFTEYSMEKLLIAYLVILHAFDWAVNAFGSFAQIRLNQQSIVFFGGKTGWDCSQFQTIDDRYQSL